MGIDFIEKTKRSFDKHLDAKRAKLATADLFTQDPEDVCQIFPANLKEGARPKVGDELTAEVDGKQIILRMGLRIVAIVDAPPSVVLQAIQESCGVATAIVQEVHEIAGVIEVTLC